jgi:hypothetical protein
VVDQPDGIAIAQYDAIGAPDDPRVVDFARRFSLDGGAVARLSTDLSCATDGRLKVLRRQGYADQRYDLEADPLETVPLPDGPAFAALTAALDAIASAAPVPAAPASEDASQAAIDDEERAALERQMRLLGYL